MALPSLLGALVAYGVVLGPAFALAIEREDGTLLRARVTPHGVAGYVTGQLLLQSLGLLPMFFAVLVPSLLLFEGVAPHGPGSLLTVLWVLGLGLLATLPLGVILGSLASSVQRVATWGVAPILGLAAISGIFAPVTTMWGWVQGLAQLFPMYWLGLGMRSAFLPEAAAALELGGSWRTGQTVLVLVCWGVAGAGRRAARAASRRAPAVGGGGGASPGDGGAMGSLRIGRSA